MPTVKKHLSHCSTASQWKRVGIHPHKGISLPLSALHSKDSSGIGEFFDLLPLFDWCKDLGMDIIQLLPLNDTAGDPSPYNALSSLALHPIYLSLHRLPLLSPSLASSLKNFQSLNQTYRISFQEVLTRKLQFLWTYFREQGHTLMKTAAFEEFMHRYTWVKPYAVFKTLSRIQEHSAPSSWPEEFLYPTLDTLSSLEAEHQEEVSFYQFVQFLCFLQLSEVKTIASSKGIFLKGDLPILISQDSADVWFHPEFFNTEVSIGAPPDMYATEGQNWGFPGFHRPSMKKSGFTWWKNRLDYAENFYDCYRVDHALGLFRLWSIPLTKSSKEGYFVPAEEGLWEPQGRELLQLLCSHSPLLPIAEDLGAVPPIVRPLLHEMGIPGTKVLRWERDWNTDGCFLSPCSYSPISLTCVSTHDSPTLGGWWRDFPEEAGLYAKEQGWSYEPTLAPAWRRFLLRESNTSSSLFHINLLSEYLALVPELAFSSPDEERINIPGTILPTNWTCRFRKSVEEITTSLPLKEEMRGVLF